MNKEMPSRLYKFTRRKQTVIRRGKRTSITIPKAKWHGSGLYYRRNGSWTKWDREADLKRGGRVGTGPYKYRNDLRKRSNRWR